MFQSTQALDSPLQEPQCIFCAPEEQLDNSNSLFLMMNQALISKHSSSQSNSTLTLPIDILLKQEDPCSHDENLLFCKFKQYQFEDQDQENLKREYKITEYQKKIEVLSQYYKFHKDIPRIVERDIEKILGKYYDRKREHDYKYLKRKLKQEQGLSITSIQSSDTQNSETIQKKSKYSTLLNALKQSQVKETDEQKMSDSNILAEICKQIGNALPRTKVNDDQFMGYFLDSDKKFENYVKKAQRIKKPKIRKSNRFEWPSHGQSFKKKMKFQEPQNNFYDFKKNLKPKEDEKTLKNRVKNQSNHKRSNKERSYRNDRSDKLEKSDQKRKFIYNTNVKIQIKNALFELKAPDQRFGTAEKIGKSRKSLVGKVTALNEDKYRTPVSKIYQAQQVEPKYRKRSSLMKKQRLGTKESKQIYDRTRNTQPIKRAISTHVFDKRSIDVRHITQDIHERNLNRRVVSVGKLKLDNQISMKFRGTSHFSSAQKLGQMRRIGQSSESLRKKSISITHHTGARNSAQKTPIMKYSSSEFKQPSKSRGVSIKDLLTKKLNIYERN